jgi:protein tyrosine phosphatase
MCIEPLDTDDSIEPVIRKFSISNAAEPHSEARIITHFQYREWPDHGLPASPTGFLRLVQLVCQVDSGTPIVVHCSAGIGRTGTFCTVHSIICMMTTNLNLHGTLPPINIVRTVLNFRDQRPGMVQNKDQYMFCYLSILQEYTKLQKMVPKRNAGGLS